MNLIQKIKFKLQSKKSFKKNELDDMGPGKPIKALKGKK